jgi:predicted aspartyl protease
MPVAAHAQVVNNNYGHAVRPSCRALFAVPSALILKQRAVLHDKRLAFFSTAMRAGLALRSFLLVWISNAVSLASALHLNTLSERAHISGLSNGQNIKYSANLTLNGKTFSVLIDTGRSVPSMPLSLSLFRLGN